MPTESDPTPPTGAKRYTRPKPGPEDFVVYEVDGWAQLTPEQKTWPVVTPLSQRGPEPRLEAPPEADEAPDPKLPPPG